MLRNHVAFSTVSNYRLCFRGTGVHVNGLMLPKIKIPQQLRKFAHSTTRSMITETI